MQLTLKEAREIRRWAENRARVSEEDSRNGLEHSDDDACEIVRNLAERLTTAPPKGDTRRWHCDECGSTEGLTVQVQMDPNTRLIEAEGDKPLTPTMIPVYTDRQDCWCEICDAGGAWTLKEPS
jgi:hypothetical protein